jgi:hypothetical protein
MRERETTVGHMARIVAAQALQIRILQVAWKNADAQGLQARH